VGLAQVPQKATSQEQQQLGLRGYGGPSGRSARSGTEASRHSGVHRPGGAEWFAGACDPSNQDSITVKRRSGDIRAATGEHCSSFGMQHPSEPGRQGNT